MPSKNAPWRIRELLSKIKELKQVHVQEIAVLKDERDQLRARVIELEEELRALREKPKE